MAYVRGSSEPEFQSDTLWADIDVTPARHQDSYVDSYAHFGIHEEMIKDTVRTESYKNAIMRNKHLFEGKVVLDVGCGTGILSIFAARAGAAHVYAVDFADIVLHAQHIMKENGLSDRITCIKGKVEEIDLPVEKVDIIISEWMGYFLLYESMLETVLYARDKWLVEDGLMFPDKARIYVAAIEDAKYKYDKFDWWTDVYGIDMSNMRDLAILEPVVDIVNAQNLISNLCPVYEIDIPTMTRDQLSFVAQYQLNVTRTDYLHGLIAWFEVGFVKCHKPITLSTSPRMKSTHWKQTVFYIEQNVPVNADDVLQGSIAVKPNDIHPREQDIKLSFHIKGKLDHTQFYRLK